MNSLVVCMAAPWRANTVVSAAAACDVFCVGVRCNRTYCFLEHLHLGGALLKRNSHVLQWMLKALVVVACPPRRLR